jgi:parvulin-like peptidyl-prolyl isomerase
LNQLKDFFRSDDVDPESRNRVLLIGGLVVIVLFAITLAAVGYYVDRIAPRGDTVFSVGDREFSYDYLEDRVNAFNAEGLLNTNNLALGIAQVVSDIQNEELTRLIAKEEGVTLSEEEFDLAMREDVGVGEDAPRNTFATALRSRLQQIGLSLGRYEEMIEAAALEQKLRDRIAEDIPAEMEMVDLNVILAETDAAASSARQRILDGEEFATVAQEVSIHSTASQGGEVGWTPAELLVADLAEAAFAQEVGELSEVIETETGFYIILVEGKETREVGELVRNALISTRFGDRLEAASETYELENVLTVEQAQRIANQLEVSGG